MKFAISLLFSLLIVLQVVSVRGDSTDHGKPELKISSGKLKGKSVDFRGVKVNQFLSIPYAEPPVGELRFKKPIAKKPWDHVLEANHWGSHCMQMNFPEFNPGFEFSEDCLLLNVFATDPKLEGGSSLDEKLRPVFFWIHGGGFNFGSANVPQHYDGTALAAMKDVIVVSINYRLGVFGFLRLPEAGVPGNMGLWDQRLALQWVKENIRFFGGDPDKVTIFGESAGSFSVSALVVSPHAKGLFRNAIMQSGAMYDLKRWVVKDIDGKFVSALGCSSDPESIKSCLLSYEFGQSKEVDDLLFWPVSGDEFLPTDAEEIIANKGVDPNLNLLIGTVGNEGALMLLIKDPISFHPHYPLNLTLAHGKYILRRMFGKSLVDYYSDRYLTQIDKDDSDSIRSAITKALGDTILTCPTYAFARDLAQSGHRNVYSYYQSQRPTQGIMPIATGSKWLPASHTDDIPMVFGHPFLFPGNFTVEDTILSSIMMDTWVDFAINGKPSKLGPRQWLPWTHTDKLSYPTMVLDSKKIGQLETDQIEFCLKNWPIPFDAFYDLRMEPGAFANIEHHDEL